MKKTRQEKGITLIALVISIILLLILAAVTINAITGDGIIAHAQNATTKYGAAQTAEEIQMLELEYELQKMQGQTTLSKSEYVFQKIYGDTIGIGTKVAYNSGVEGYSGEWAILGVENGQLMLLSESIGTLTLQGKDGYTNAVNQLDTMCAPYGNGKGAVSARSVRVEDINNVTGYNPYKTGDGRIFREGEIGEYGNEVTYSYKDGVIAYKASNGAEGSDAKYTSYEDFDGTIISSENPTKTAKYTSSYYYYYITTLKNTSEANDPILGVSKESPAYNLIYSSTKSKNYWLANQDITTSASRTSWQIRKLSGEKVNAVTLYHSFDDDDQVPQTLGVRAVVYLEPGIELVDINSDGVYEIS